MQRKVIHGPDSENAVPGIARASAVHERSTRGAEVTGHIVARRNRLGLGEGFQVVLPAQVLEVLVIDREVRRKHGCGDLATVGAVAYE